MQNRPFTIAFFGSSLVSAYWNGAATYYRGIIRALNDLGHRVTFYEPDAFDRQNHRDIADPEYAAIHVYSAEGEQGVRAALKDARSADIVIKASGVGVFDDFLERAVLELKRPQCRVIFWDVDAPATLERIQTTPHDPFRALIPAYDLILTYGGGDAVVAAYEQWGARACIPVYNALDQRTHYPAPPDPRFECLLGFLGNRMPDREQRVWEFFFKPAQHIPQERFVLGGSGWDQHIPDAANIHVLGHVYTRDHNAFNSTARAVLNINRESMARCGFSPPTRIFEAAGAGACIITDTWEGIESFLEPERECLIAHNGLDVAAHLADLGPARATTIGKAALQRIRAEHTYQHRGRQVEALLRELCA
jgi:spore maturation protein CgeB